MMNESDSKWITRLRTSINNLNEDNLPVFRTDLNGRGDIKRIKVGF